MQMTEQEIQELEALISAEYRETLTTTEIQATLDGVRAISGAGWIEKDPEYQAIERAREIRRKMGGSEGVFDPPPFRPKGMRRAIYQRLLDEMIGATTRATMGSQKRAAERDIAGCWLAVYLWLEAYRAFEKRKQYGDWETA